MALNFAEVRRMVFFQQRFQQSADDQKSCDLKAHIYFFCIFALFDYADKLVFLLYPVYFADFTKLNCLFANVTERPSAVVVTSRRVR